MYRIFRKLKCKHVVFTSLKSNAARLRSIGEKTDGRKTAPSKMVLTSRPSFAKTLTKKSSEHSRSFAANETLQTHVAILLLGVPIWNQWRASEPLVRPSLEKADLTGLALENVNFSGVNLRGAKLDGAYLYDADFQKASLQGASLKRAVLIGANFYKANLSNAMLEHSYLAQSDLSNANFTNACLKSSDLRLALLAQSVFTNVSIESADLTDCCDLSELQLKASKDGHLAYLSDAFCHWSTVSEATSETVSEKRDESVPISLNRYETLAVSGA